MNVLYLLQQGTTLAISGEQLVIKRSQDILQSIQLPLLEYILLFGWVHITAPALRACLKSRVPITYLSRSGFCYGRSLPLDWNHLSLGDRQRAMPTTKSLEIARVMISAKLLNSRVLLLRQQRKRHSASLELAINSLSYYSQQAKIAETPDKLRGYEGAGAACYYLAFAECLSQEDFKFLGRTRRPPTNPVNAMLSFGYQILWNHLLALVELQHLDPFCGVLHTAHHGHAALVSDLIEEFRAPIADSLVLWLINSKVINIDADFEYRDRGCFLNESGKRKFLTAFVQRMEGKIQILDFPNEDRPYLPYRID
jgi:CRISPR-associated protein Cas1